MMRLRACSAHTVVRKNSIGLPSDRDAGTYLFGFPALGSPLSTRKTSGKADCGAAVQRGSRTETARKPREQALTAFVWSR